MSRFIVAMNGCPDLSPTDNSTVVIEDQNGLSLEANLNTINSNNSGVIYSCLITKAEVNDGSECTSNIFRAFPGTLYRGNTVISIEKAVYDAGNKACRLPLDGKCSEYSYQASNNPNKFPLTDNGNNSEITGDGSTENLGKVGWSTSSIPFGTGGTGPGGSGPGGNNPDALKMTCGAKTFNYSYDCFNVDIANSCTDECRSFLVFTPKDPLPSGCALNATIGGGDGGCTNGFGITNLDKQIGDFYLNVNCDKDSGTVCTMLSNTIQQCSTCGL